MKKFVSIWLLVLLTSVASVGQKFNVDITLPDSIAGKQWVIDQIRKAVTGEQPSSGINPCKAGPELKGVSNVSTAGLNGEFHGVDIVRIKWAILDAAGKQVRYGDAKPDDNKPRIQFEALPPGNYTLTFRGSSCSSEIFTYTFTIPGETGSVLNDCEKLPTIYKITAGKQGATVVFDAKNLKVLTLTLLNNAGGSITSATYKPESNTLFLSYPVQSPGPYQIRLSPVSCKDVSDTKPFTIKDESTVVVTPPIVVDPPATNPGIYKLTSIVKGMSEHLDLTFTESGDGLLMNDSATAPLGSDYEFRYLIGTHLFMSPTPVKNYFIGGHNPFRVLKMKTKIGLENTNHWSDSENNSYYSTTAGESFSYNTTGAFNTFFFKGSQQKAGFLNHIPQSYDPSTQITSWGDIGQDMQLPSGHFWLHVPWDGNIELAFRKGVTHIKHHSLPWETDINQVFSLKNEGKTYNNVPRIETILQLTKVGDNDYTNGWNRAWWPNGPLTGAEAIEKANSTDISDAVWIGETEENEAWMFNDAAFWDPFYKRLRARYEERFGSRGIPYLIAHNYYHLWRPEMSLTTGSSKEYHKNLFNTSPENLPKTVYSPGGVLSNTNLIVEGIYLNAPDIQQVQPYQLIFRLELIKHMGYTGGVFLAPVHEWRPNNPYEYIYPEGKFYAANKIPLDPNLLIANGFLAHVYGKLYTEWGGSGKTSKKTFDIEWNKGDWFPNGYTFPQPGFPYYKKPGDPTYYGFSGSNDLSYFSQKLFNDSFGKVVGGARKYLKFRIDGQQWITPDQGPAEIVNAFFDQRGFVCSDSKNGQTAWFYMNCYADNNLHILEVELPNGSIVKEFVAGNGVHVKIQDL